MPVWRMLWTSAVEETSEVRQLFRGGAMVEAERQYNRVTLSERDFRQAEAFLAAYDTGLPNVQQEALLLAAVVCYARPFTSNEKKADAKAVCRLPVDPESFLSADQMSLHNRLMTLRHKAVAHAEFDLDPVELLEVYPDGMSTRGPYFDILQQELDISLFQTVAEAMFCRCRDLRHRLKDEVARTSLGQADACRSCGR